VLAEKGRPAVRSLALRLPRVDEALLQDAVRDRDRVGQVRYLTRGYILVNTAALTLYSYSAMSEEALSREVTELLAGPINDLMGKMQSSSKAAEAAESGV
jgi:hypothetical protein